VAVSWSVLFAPEQPMLLSILVGTVTTLVYLGDRLVDTYRLPADAPLMPRHATVRALRPVFIKQCALLAILALLLTIELASERGWAWVLDGALLFGALIAYLSLAQLLPRVFRVLLPRELLIGAFFAAMLGFVVPAELRDERALVLFGMLCAANAHGVALAERGLDEALGVESLVRSLPRGFRSDLLLLGATFVAAALYPCAWQLELLVATALQFLLFALRRGSLRIAMYADLPLYGTALFFLAASLVA
jgi:hypothetical protein